MKLEIDLKISDFFKHALSFLENESAVHSFIISLARRYEQNALPIALLARGIDDNKTVIAGIQTEHDRSLIMSNASESVASQFAVHLFQKNIKLPGVHGPVPTVDAFAESWNSNRKQLSANMRLFELQKVIPPSPPPGLFRCAKSSDENILLQWLQEFHDEAVPHDPKRSEAEMRKDIQDAISKGQFFIWEDNGKPVCLVGSRRQTETEKWIAPVYTPKRLRGKGYASALVAEVSQQFVKAGKKGMLFTDLANPTSNSIYQKVGYNPVADFKHFLFL